MSAMSDQYVAALPVAIPTPRCRRHLTYILASCADCREANRVKR